MPSDGRYWSYVCDDPDCCPSEGIPFDVSASAVAAAATVVGLVALPDRQSLVRLVAPVDGAARASMLRATLEADHRLVDLIAAAGGTDLDDLDNDVVDDLDLVPDLDITDRAVLDAVMRAGERAIDQAVARHRGGGRLTDNEAAWLSLLASVIPVRNRAWQKVLDDQPAVQIHHDLWLDLLRRADPDLVPAGGCLFAVCAWFRRD